MFNTYSDNPQGVKIFNNETNLITDLLKLFSFIYYNKIPLLKNNKIRKNNYTKILKNFVLIKNPAYLDFLLDFSVDKKFIGHKNRIWDINFDAIIEFLNSSGEAFRSVYKFMIHKISNEKKIKIVLNTLSSMQSNKWVDFNVFHRQLIKLSKSFIDPPTFFKNKYYAHKHVDSNKQQIENLFAEYLYWTGIVKTTFKKGPEELNKNSPKEKILEIIEDIVISNNLNQTQLNDLQEEEAPKLYEIYTELYRLTKLNYNLSQFTITPLGRALLNNRKNLTTFFPKKEKKFIVQPNFEIIIPPHFDEKKYFNLLSFIETIKTETLNTFRISKQSIYNAILEGISAKEISKFLTENSKVKVPANVIELIDTCYSQFNKIEIYKNQFILKASKLIIKKIEHDPDLAGFIQDKLNSETLLLKSKTNINKLIKKYKSYGLNTEVKTFN